MKRVGKPVFFIVLLLIGAFSYLTIFGYSTNFGSREDTVIKGVKDIRFGMDIKGGISVTFKPGEGVSVNKDQLEMAQNVIKARLVSSNVTDFECFTDDDKNRIIVRFPWKSDEKEFDVAKAIDELGATAVLTFREGKETTTDEETGVVSPSGVTESNIILEGKDIKNARPGLSQEDNKPVVILTLNDSGVSKFTEATTRLASSQGTISIWMDNNMISYPTVQTAITGTEATITGIGDMQEAEVLSGQIASGALPFKLETDGYSSVNPTLGSNALKAMVLGGAIAFALICIMMLVLYRLPGVVASICLAGQVAGILACVSGFFEFIPSFTLTLPGIAGIILSIGMGVDANIIQNERIKEELRSGKTLDGSISAGYENSFSAVFDGNITTIIVAVVLMGVFGPSDNIFATILKPFLFMFGPSTTGAIYSFGFTLLVGNFFNFIMGVTCSRLLQKSLARFKPLRNKVLYAGGVSK